MRGHPTVWQEQLHRAEAQLRQLSTQHREKDAALSERDRQLAEKERQLAEKEIALGACEVNLAEARNARAESAARKKPRPLISPRAPADARSDSAGTKTRPTRP